MYDFVIQSIFILSLGLLVYLLALALPRVTESPIGNSKLRRWAANLPLDRLDDFLVRTSEKALRKTKVIVLKIDNSVSRKLTHRDKGLAR